MQQFESSTGFATRGFFDLPGISVSGSPTKSTPSNAQCLSDADLAVPFCAIMTDEPERILNYAAEWFEKDGKSALITLVDIRGGSARALGAQMAVSIDGGYCGYVSGGCTEAAIATEAINAIHAADDRFLLLGEGSIFFDINLPCGGGITLAIHVLKDVRPIRRVLAKLRSRKVGFLSYDAARQTITDAEAPENKTFYIRHYRPRLRLVIAGRGIELDCAARIAHHSGFETLAFEDRSPAKFDDAIIDADTAIALLFHDLDLELPFLKAALQKGPFYIGALGSRRTHERRREALHAHGYAKLDIDRIKAPIGMFGPARDANFLALSVLADIAAARSSVNFDGDV